MPALVAGIHVFLSKNKDVDGRDKPGHDEGMGRKPLAYLNSSDLMMIGTTLVTSMTRPMST